MNETMIEKRYKQERIPNEVESTKQEKETTIRRGFGLTGSSLKLIALALMLIDHIGACLVLRYLKSIGYIIFSVSSYAQLLEYFKDPGYALYFTLRLIGRLAFPLFCFLLVEGFFHTKSRIKYALRLAIFALLSEVPFDLAFSTLGNLKAQNVFFTLLIGLLTIWLMDLAGRGVDAWRGLYLRLEESRVEAKKLQEARQKNSNVRSASAKNGSKDAKETAGNKVRQSRGEQLGATRKGATITGVAFTCIKVPLYVLFTILGAAAAYYAHVDYDVAGIIVIVVMYLCQKNNVHNPCTSTSGKEQQLQQQKQQKYQLDTVGSAQLFKEHNKRNNTMGALLSVYALTLYDGLELTAFFSALLIRAYNGERGLRLKYVFYFFYPVHLLILVAICNLLHI